MALWLPVLAFGNLNNGSNDGRRNANLNNGLSNSNWNYAARISANIDVPCFAPLKGAAYALGRNARNRRTSTG